jgi:FkbM family methyltransferase
MRLVRTSTWDEMRTLSFFYWNDPFLQLFSSPERIKELVPFSKAQVRQDLFVLDELDFKSGGYFIEIGAASGVEMSNTWLLEKKFDWNGILCEPSKRYSETLPKLRSGFVENRFVWSKSGVRKQFLELGDSGLSTLTQFASQGIHGATRVSSRSLTYEVQSISLNDLLIERKAPHEIDYISVDTEGSEFEILNSFDFKKWRVKIFTIEHNFEIEAREAIFDLMKRNGYVRKYENISHQDDWYVLQ